MSDSLPEGRAGVEAGPADGPGPQPEPALNGAVAPRLGDGKS